MNSIFAYSGGILSILLIGASFFIPSPWNAVSIILGALIALGIIIERTLFASRVGEMSSIGESLSRVILEHAPVGVLVYDSSFRVFKANKELEDMFGLSSSDMPKKLDASQASDTKMQRFIQCVFLTLAPAVIRRTASGEYPSVADVIFTDPPLNIRVTTQRVIDGEGKVVAFVKLFVNKTREAELLRSKTEFIGVAAHQLRTPLTATNWALEGLHDETLTDSQKELVDTGKAAIENALRTVNSLLDVSKIEEGKFGYSFETVPLVSYLDELLKEVYPLAKESGIKLYFDRPAQDVSVVIDKEKMRMVVLNLLDNALKYNIENGEITVRIGEGQEGFVTISIEDTGIGIPQDQIDKLFGKFFRAENAMRAVADGTGLGLYIARNIVRGHGGDISVISELKRGSIFTLSLPTDSSYIPQHEPSLLDEL